MDDRRSTLPDPPVPTAGVERSFGVDNVMRALGVTQSMTRCGRYELVEKLGEGAMGVVYRAYDPKLRRSVAIKLLREDTDEDARFRLRREAHALARLSDPRVVTVLAVGEARGQTWVAMELVEGQTLAGWAKATAGDVSGRRARALELLTEAGLGLAAAHRAGLVHRDFKPANVLLSRDGQVKIADFGLAKTGERHPTLPDGSTGRTHSTTQTTAVAGTPLYMAPEQHMGLSTDARCDQFAFAVTAWELLTGRPPFVGRTLVALGEAKLEGITEQRRVSLPAHIRRALVRAMSPAPEDRFADMSALLRALDRKRSTRTRVLGLVGIATVSAILSTWSIGSPQHPCGQLEPPQWNAHNRESLRSSFLRGGTLDANEAWTKLEDDLGDYASRWVRTRDAACVAAAPEQAPAIAACLDRAARSFDEAMAIAVADPKAALRGTRMVAELPALDCGSRPLPPTSRHREVEAALSRAAVLRAAHKLDDELGLLERIEPVARGLDDPAIRARVLAALADARSRAAHGPAALRSLEEAHALAVEARDDAAAMEVALSAIEVLFEYGGTAQEIEGWLREAKVAQARLGDAPTSQAVWLLVYEAQLRRTMHSDYERALALATDALAAAQTLDPASDPNAMSTRAAVHQELADLHFELGNIADAETQAQLVIDWTAKDLGADHPATKDHFSYLSDALVARGRYPEALAALETALEGARANSGGGPCSSVAMLLTKSSQVHRLLDQPEVALEDAREAVRMLEDIGAASGLLTDALAALSVAQQHAGDLASARATGERIVAITEADLGPRHADLGPALYNLGDVLLLLGQPNEAEARFRASLEIAEGAFGLDAPDLAYPLSGLGEVALLSGRTQAAEALLSRASKLAADHPDAMLVARIRWCRARALVATDATRARTLAHDAVEAYRQAGREEDTADIEAWLAAHPLPG